MKNYSSIPYCGDCPYFLYEDANGSGICNITNTVSHCHELCPICTTAEYLTPKELAKLLSKVNKWRRGGKGEMPSPTLIGFAIDEAIRWLRFIHRNKDKLTKK